METAFCEYHSGAAPAMGSLWIGTLSALPSSAASTRIRQLSTQEPMWSTGGIFSDSQTARRSSPASDAASAGEAGLSRCDRGASRLDTENISLDQFLCQGHMPEVVLHVRVVAPDNTDRSPDLPGSDQVDERFERAAERVLDRLVGESCHDRDGSPGIRHPLGSGSCSSPPPSAQSLLP